MVTAEEVAGIEVFAMLGPDQQAQLARSAADVILASGEYAANEGDDRALFAVLEGKIEAVKTVDGIDNVVGERLPGDVFGEVPIVLGSPFPVGFRAAVPSRVLRLRAAEYHLVAAVDPIVSKAIGALAQFRMTGDRGLQGLASRPPAPRAIVLGQWSDPACTQLRHFLHRNQISFSWVRPDASDAEEQWKGPLPAVADRPAIRLAEGKTVVRPELRRIAELFGLGTEPEAAEYDTVVIGAGPSGLAAAVYGASEGLRTLVVEREAPGGQAGTSSRIENYLGFPSGVSGDELASRALQQARRLGAEILVTRRITRLDSTTRELHLDGGDVLRASTIILACGVSWRTLDADGLEPLVGKGVHYGAARSEGPNVHGLDIHIVGAGNSAGQAALFFSEHARSVTILYRGESLAKSMSQYLVDQLAARSNINVCLGTEIVAAHGEDSLEAIDVKTALDGDPVRLASDGLFIFIGADAETAWLPPEIALDSRGYVLTGADLGATDSWPL
ncbi:MAG TPA: FAD-dependent oxidoreductase, partial [Candidatus Dormibacteraeota bacterium]|nr:FAD-dependent oxidoreductase [Candidatus Dormibacteraeota bacterium]